MQQSTLDSIELVRRGPPAPGSEVVRHLDAVAAEQRIAHRRQVSAVHHLLDGGAMEDQKTEAESRQRKREIVAGVEIEELPYEPTPMSDQEADRSQPQEGPQERLEPEQEG